MDNNTIKDLLQSKYNDAIVAIEESYGILDVIVHRSSIKDILRKLKADGDLEMSFLTSLCGVHYPDKVGHEMDVVYHLHSLIHNKRLRLHVIMPISDAVLPTISDIIPTANWMERETYEFYGVKFEGHPDLRVILNVEDIGYHPLLKQYQLTDATRTDKEDKYFGR
jgi:NADH-quinone oxidoreductase subunit C